METKTNPSGTRAPCISLLGLSVHHKEDGCWMMFQASNGMEACINLNVYADNSGSITGAAIRRWIEDVRPGAGKKPLTDTDPMPFGKHRGIRMQDVPASYLFWLWTEAGKEQDHQCPVADYIRRNLEALKLEYPNGIWK